MYIMQKTVPFLFNMDQRFRELEKLQMPIPQNNFCNFGPFLFLSLSSFLQSSTTCYQNFVFLAH